jgi:hypothetical protein
LKLGYKKVNAQSEGPVSNHLAPLNRIRVETALSRFPIHRLARKGEISINLAGETDFQWKVSYNREYGQPGPHAYKVDTLIVNRRIDEAPRPLPEMIRIGSLREINRALGLAEEDTQTIKKALLQNASAFISAKIRFKPKNARGGREYWREIHYTRYSVIFNGEPLPDGRIADAVYIILNPPHRKMLNDVEVRPLDYDYLMQLAPGPQRFYELLSFQVYGAIHSGRPRAKMLYSDYCKYAPQTRYQDFNHMKKQMYKVHLPHRESGYIIKVDYQQTTDAEGKSDWEMFYTPGPKAMVEYQAFTNRQIRQHSAAPLALQSTFVELSPPAEHACLELSDADTTLLTEMSRRGITEKKAHALLANLKPGQELMDQLKYVDHLIAQAPRGKFHNPSGFTIKFIEDNAPVPDDFSTSRKLKRRIWDQAQQAKNAERAQHASLEIAYDEYRHETLERYIRENLPAEEYQQMFVQLRKQNRKFLKLMTDAQIDKISHNGIRHELKQSGRVPLISLDEFRQQQKQKQKAD